MLNHFFTSVYRFFYATNSIVYIAIQIPEIVHRIPTLILQYYYIYNDVDIELCKVGPCTISSKEYIYYLLSISDINHIPKSQTLISLRTPGFKETLLAQLIIQSKVKDFVNNNLNVVLSENDINQGAMSLAKGLSLYHNAAFVMHIEGSLYMQIMHNQMRAFAKNHYRKYIHGLLSSIKKEDQLRILEFYVHTDESRSLYEAEIIADTYISMLQANEDNIYSFISKNSDSQIVTDCILCLSDVPIYVQQSYYTNTLKPGSLLRWSQPDGVYVYLIQDIYKTENSYDIEQISNGIAQLLFKSALMSYEIFIEINDEGCMAIGIDPMQVRKLLL